MLLSEGGSGRPTLVRPEEDDALGPHPEDWQKVLRLPPAKRRNYAIKAEPEVFQPAESGLSHMGMSFRVREIAEQYEDAYIDNAGRIPVTWFANLPQEDLNLLTNPATAERVNPTLIEHAQQLSINRQLQADIERKAAERYESEKMIQDWINRSQYRTLPGTELDPVIPGEKYNQASWEAARDEYFAPINQDFVPWVEKGFKALGSVFAIGGMALLSPFTVPHDIGRMFLTGNFEIPKTYQHILAEFTGYDRDLDGNPRPRTTSDATLAMREQVRQAQTGELLEEHKDMMYAGVFLPNLAEQVRIEMPDLWAELLNMYGDEETARLGLMLEAQDMRTELTDEDQLRGWVEDMYQEQEHLLEEMELADFQSGHVVVRGFATYGQWVTGNAAGLTAFLSDEEAQDLMRDMKFEEAFDRIAQVSEEGGHTPSGVLGLEGTLVGIGADFGFGMVVDPINWFFGPKTLGINGLATRASVVQRLASPATRMYLRTFGRDFNSAARSFMGQASMAIPFMEMGKGAQLLNVMGRTVGNIPYGLWRRSLFGRKSQVVPLSTVLSWSDDIAMGKIGRQQLDDAARQLQNEGFDLPVKAVYSPDEGRVVFHDPNDIARVMAAESLGEKDVPVTIRVINETTDKPHMSVVEDGPFPARITRELETDESVLLDGALKEWMDQPQTIQRRVNSIVAGHLPTGPRQLSKLDDLDNVTDKDIVRTVNEWNKARAMIRWYQKKAEPTPGLFRGDSNLDIQPGEIIELPMASATNSASDARGFAGTAIDPQSNQDIGVGWVLEFDETTPSVAHPSGQRLYFVSGRFEVISTGAVTGIAKVRYVDSLLPEIPDRTGLPTGVPYGVDVEGPRHLPIERIDKADYARPSDVFGETVLPRWNQKGFKDLVEETLMIGGDIPAARQTWAAVGLGRMFRSLMKHDPFNVTGLNRYFRSTFNRNRIGIQGPGGRARLLEQLEFLAADYPEFLNHWINRILENEELSQRTQFTKAGAVQEVTRLREIETMLNEKSGIMSGFNALADEFPDLEPLSQAAKDAASLRILLKEEIRTRIDDIRRARELDSEVAQSWSELTREMWEDYNRQHIATNPQWAGFVDESGMVPWNVIHRGPSGSSNQVQGVVLEASQEATEKSAVARVATDYGVKTEEMQAMLNQVGAYTSPESAVVLPATPIELLAATELGGSKFTKWTQNHWINGARQSLFFLDQLWKANVLLSPRTFFVMSFDELLSMFHTYGHSAVADYMKTRGARWYSRMQALMHGKLPSVKRGEPYLGTTTGDLIRSNLDTPQHQREYARALSEATSQEKLILEPGSLGYPKAAQDWAQMELENPGFRAFLAGPTSFKNWFTQTQEGMNYQYRVTVYDRTPEGESFTRPISDHVEGYQLFANAWQLILERARDAGLKPKREADYLAAWRDVAEQIDSDPTHRVRALPDWTWQYFGPLEGTMPLYPGRGLSWELISRVYQGGAANPSFFRQGVIMNTARESELARLETLRRSHPTHRQLADADGNLSTASLIEVVRGNGWPMTLLDPEYRGILDQLLADQGFLTDSWVGTMAERRAEQAVDDLTYSFEEGSRAGLLTRPIWPFGRAWGEMYGRWGRSLASHMAVRNIWQKVPGIGKLLRGVANISPINLRTAAFLSRFSALNLSVTEGLAGGGGGLVPGTTETDFTPLTFLPTINGGPATLMPGLGPVGLPVLSAWLESKFDPVEDPQGYQAMQDFLSQVIPGIRFSGQGALTQTMGGGNLGLLMSTLGDVQTGIFHRTFREGGYLSGDLGREIERNRQVSALLSDPGVMADILGEGDPEMVRAILMGVNNQADTQASQSHFIETATKWFVPSRTHADSALDEIYNTWVQAGRQFDILHTANLDRYDDQDFRKDGDLLRETGDRIRRNFFNLPPWERDALIAVMPTLATNMITGWEWRQNLPASIPNQDRPYTIASGSPEELDRHNLYASRGWIVPKDSNLRGFHIVGRALDARFNTAQNLYEFQAEFLNNFRWDNGLISEETHALLDFLVTTPEMKELGLTDQRTLWKKWGSLGEAVVDTWARELGLEFGSDEYEAFASKFNIPDSKSQPDEAWGETWRGDMTEAYSQRFRDLQIFEFDERTERLADLLNIPLTPGMTGEEFINGVLQYKKGNESAAWNAVRYEYDGYISERGRDVVAAFATLDDYVQNPATPAEASAAMSEFITWADIQSDRSYEEGSLPRLIQDEAVDRWMRMTTGLRDAPVAWDKIWRDAFQQMFGPLDWTPPEPPSLINAETGERNENAWRPVVVSVEDGDTINVSKYTGPAVSGDFPSTRFLESEEGTPRYHSVRLLGVMADDYGINEANAEADKRRLEDRLLQAFENGDTIWLIRDPEYTGSPVDGFGRELAWLYIGDEPYWFPEDMTRTDS